MKEGYTNLFAANDLKTALDILNNKKIDLVLFNLALSESLVIEICKYIRNDHKISDIPILAQGKNIPGLSV